MMYSLASSSRDRGLCHPAYSSVTASILHGAQPDSVVLCHEAGRERVGGYDDFPLPDPATCADYYEAISTPVSAASVDAGALDTSDRSDSAAEQAIEEYASAIDAPATDPVRHDTGEILDAILG